MNHNVDEFAKLVFEEQEKFKKNSLFFYTVEQIKQNRIEVDMKYDDPVVIAFIKELCFRKLNMDAYPVQLMAALRLFEGNVIEMNTGEGKTLVAIMSALMHVLNHRKVHILTANDYLAQRDYHLAKSVFEELGIRCGVMTSTTSLNERIEMSDDDIIYTTNKEIAINYSNNRKAVEAHSLIMNPFDVVIVDEADLLMIDEARKELSIGNESEVDASMFEKTKTFVSSLNEVDVFVANEGYDFYLTDSGVEKAQEFYEINNYYNQEHVEIRNAIRLAYIAQHFYKKDVDYVIKDGVIMLINKQTGRLMYDYKMFNGLQQALECKEGLVLSPIKTNFTKLPYQMIYNLYRTKSGMTGTAITEAKEFKEMYHLDVVSIPTNKPNIRQDYPDKIFVNKEVRDNAVVQKVEELHAQGQPILIGTTSIEHSEVISALLKEKNIPHQLLNAKQHEKEAMIIQRAGELGAVTIATNMAGRGTDIKVPEESLSLGGLFVLGTERYDSRRSDNQLRGRTGRQGDPGIAQFYTSIEDDILNNLNTGRIQQLMSVLRNVEKKDYIENPTITNLYNKSQIALEGKHYEERKQLLQRSQLIHGYYANYFDRKLFLLRSDFTQEEILQLLLKSLQTDMSLHAKELKTLVDASLLNKERVLKSSVNMNEFYEIFNHFWILFIGRLDSLSLSTFLNFAGIGNRELLLQKRINAEYTKTVLQLKLSLIDFMSSIK